MYFSLQSGQIKNAVMNGLEDSNWKSIKDKFIGLGFLQEIQTKPDDFIRSRISSLADYHKHLCLTT